MLAASKKGEAVTEENGYRQRLRNKKAAVQNAERPYGVNWSAMAERTEYYPGEKNRAFRGGVNKKALLGAYHKDTRTTHKPKIAGGNVAGMTGDKPPATGTSLNNYRTQINKFIESLEEYKNFELSLKNTHEALVNMRMDLLSSTEIEPDEVPDVQSSIQDILGISDKKLDTEDNSRPTMSDKGGVSEIQDALSAMEEENRKLVETLAHMSNQLKAKDEEMSKFKDSLFPKPSKGGEGDVAEKDAMKQTIIKLDHDNRVMAEKLQRLEGEKGEGRDVLNKKIRSLEKLIESLHVEVKKLKDQLKLEREVKDRYETENRKLLLEIKDLKTLASSSDSKYIILEKDAKIQDLQKRLTEISRIRPRPANQGEVFKVDFSADTPSLVNQLANFVQLYEELSREGFDLESKLKEAHVEIYRLEQILEKQLIKIKEQDECLKNMEESLSKVVVESRKNSRLDHNAASACQCEQYRVIIKEKEEFSEKLKEKMSLLYQKYKQYKAECNLMKKKVDTIEKRSWLKKLVNI